VQGYNVTILAYGQTGSGKSLTMVGHDSGDADTRGIIPRIAEELFEGPAAANGRAKVTLKLMEIYNEQVKDLLADAPSGEKQVPLRVREDPTTGPYVEGLRKHTVATYAEVAKLMEVSSLIARLQLCGESEREREREYRRHTAMQKRIGLVGISGERSLTRPFRDARRFPSTRL
jgi:hypothetical protein